MNKHRLNMSKSSPDWMLWMAYPSELLRTKNHWKAMGWAWKIADLRGFDKSRLYVV